MRHIAASPDFREGFTEMLPACVGLVPFGLVCGVGAASAGADVWAALGMSMIMFSGAAQILASQLLAEGAPFAVVVLTCFVAGLRFLMYSAAMAPYLKSLPSRWQNAIAFLLTDQAFAASIRRFDRQHGTRGDRQHDARGDAKHDPRGGALHALGGGLALWGCWQITNTVGYFAGNLIPARWSLDFAVPLCFIALVAPHLDRLPTIAAAASAAFAVFALAGLPMKLNLIAAGLVGIVVGTLVDFARERWTAR
jgi:predicted branched-subunit amino acid permease